MRLDDPLRKPIIALKKLYSGGTVKIDDYEYIMCEDDELCIKCQSYNSEHPEGKDCYLKTDMSLKTFIKLCNKISDDDIFITGAEIALREMKIR